MMRCFTGMFNAKQIRNDFPILSEKIYGKKLVYLDNAATSQMPVQVMDAIIEQYRKYNANVHRGIHYLSERSTVRLEHARESISRLINADDCGKIVFTSGTTEGINLVAQSYIRPKLKEGDRIVTTELEHHSNYVVWQQLCKETGAEFVVIKAPEGVLDMDRLKECFNDRTRLVAVTAVSNVTGTVNDIERITQLAHAAGTPVLIDAAQTIRHRVPDVARNGYDFLCFSGHKIMGPSGTGVLYIRNGLSDQMLPYRYGGGMVDIVTEQETIFARVPSILEAGTPNISGIIALGEAVSYLQDLGLDEISAYESELLRYAEDQLAQIPGIRILGHPAERAGVLSFTADGVHPYDLAGFMDKYGVAVRSGSHCAQPIHNAFGIQASVRLSPAFYNTFEELDYCMQTLEKVCSQLRKWSR